MSVLLSSRSLGPRASFSQTSFRSEVAEQVDAFSTSIRLGFYRLLNGIHRGYQWVIRNPHYAGAIVALASVIWFILSGVGSQSAFAANGLDGAGKDPGQWAADLKGDPGKSMMYSCQYLTFCRWGLSSSMPMPPDTSSNLFSQVNTMGATVSSLFSILTGAGFAIVGFSLMAIAAIDLLDHFVYPIDYLFAQFGNYLYTPQDGEGVSPVWWMIIIALVLIALTFFSSMFLNNSIYSLFAKRSLLLTIFSVVLVSLMGLQAEKNHPSMDPPELSRVGVISQGNGENDRPLDLTVGKEDGWDQVSVMRNPSDWALLSPGWIISAMDRVASFGGGLVVEATQGLVRIADATRDSLPETAKGATANDACRAYTNGMHRAFSSSGFSNRLNGREGLILQYDNMVQELFFFPWAQSAYGGTQSADQAWCRTMEVKANKEPGDQIMVSRAAGLYSPLIGRGGMGLVGNDGNNYVDGFGNIHSWGVGDGVLVNSDGGWISDESAATAQQVFGPRFANEGVSNEKIYESGTNKAPFVWAICTANPGADQWEINPEWSTVMEASTVDDIPKKFKEFIGDTSNIEVEHCADAVGMNGYDKALGVKNDTAKSLNYNDNGGMVAALVGASSQAGKFSTAPEADSFRVAVVGGTAWDGAVSSALSFAVMVLFMKWFGWLVIAGFVTVFSTAVSTLLFLLSLILLAIPLRFARSIVSALFLTVVSSYLTNYIIIGILGMIIATANIISMVFSDSFGWYGVLLNSVLMVLSMMAWKIILRNISRGTMSGSSAAGRMAQGALSPLARALGRDVGGVTDASWWKNTWGGAYDRLSNFGGRNPAFEEATVATDSSTGGAASMQDRNQQNSDSKTFGSVLRDGAGRVAGKFGSEALGGAGHIMGLSPKQKQLEKQDKDLFGTEDSQSRSMFSDLSKLKNSGASQSLLRARTNMALASMGLAGTTRNMAGQFFDKDGNLITDEDQLKKLSNIAEFVPMDASKGFADSKAAGVIDNASSTLDASGDSEGAERLRNTAPSGSVLNGEEPSTEERLQGQVNPVTTIPGTDLEGTPYGLESSDDVPMSEEEVANAMGDMQDRVSHGLDSDGLSELERQEAVIAATHDEGSKTNATTSAHGLISQLDDANAASISPTMKSLAEQVSKHTGIPVDELTMGQMREWLATPEGFRFTDSVPEGSELSNLLHSEATSSLGDRAQKVTDYLKGLDSMDLERLRGDIATELGKDPSQITNSDMVNMLAASNPRWIEAAMNTELQRDIPSAANVAGAAALGGGAAAIAAELAGLANVSSTDSDAAPAQISAELSRMSPESLELLRDHFGNVNGVPSDGISNDQLVEMIRSDQSGSIQGLSNQMTDGAALGADVNALGAALQQGADLEPTSQIASLTNALGNMAPQSLETMRSAVEQMTGVTLPEGDIAALAQGLAGASPDNVASLMSNLQSQVPDIALGALAGGAAGLAAGAAFSGGSNDAADLPRADLSQARENTQDGTDFLRWDSARFDPEFSRSLVNYLDPQAMGDFLNQMDTMHRGDLLSNVTRMTAETQPGELTKSMRDYVSSLDRSQFNDMKDSLAASGATGAESLTRSQFADLLSRSLEFDHVDAISRNGSSLGNVLVSSMTTDADRTKFAEVIAGLSSDISNGNSPDIARASEFIESLTPGSSTRLMDALSHFNPGIDNAEGMVNTLVDQITQRGGDLMAADLNNVGAADTLNSRLSNMVQGSLSTAGTTALGAGALAAALATFNDTMPKNVASDDLRSALSQSIAGVVAPKENLGSLGLIQDLGFAADTRSIAALALDHAQGLGAQVGDRDAIANSLRNALSGDSQFVANLDRDIAAMGVTGVTAGMVIDQIANNGADRIKAPTELLNTDAIQARLDDTVSRMSQAMETDQGFLGAFSPQDRTSLVETFQRNAQDQIGQAMKDGAQGLTAAQMTSSMSQAMTSSFLDPQFAQALSVALPAAAAGAFGASMFRDTQTKDTARAPRGNEYEQHNHYHQNTGTPSAPVFDPQFSEARSVQDRMRIDSLMNSMNKQQAAEFRTIMSDFVKRGIGAQSPQNQEFLQRMDHSLTRHLMESQRIQRRLSDDTRNSLGDLKSWMEHNPQASTSNVDSWPRERQEQFNHIVNQVNNQVFHEHYQPNSPQNTNADGEPVFILPSQARGNLAYRGLKSLLDRAQQARRSRKSGGE